MKKQIYYLTFTLLGALLGFLIHMVTEIWIIRQLVQGAKVFGHDITWDGWQLIHNYGTLLLVAGLGWFGYRMGVKFWRILYVQKKYTKRWGIKLKENF